MRTYVANPNYADAQNSEYWDVVGAPDHATALADLTKLSVGSITVPVVATGSTAYSNVYTALNVEDISRLMKGWSTLARQSQGPRNTFISTAPRDFAKYGETFVYVNDVEGFTNGDAFALLEGLKPGADPYSAAATSADYGMSRYSTVLTTGLIPTTRPRNSNLGFNENSSYAIPGDIKSVTCNLVLQEGIDQNNTFGGDPKGSSDNPNPISSARVPTPDNINNGTIGDWYIVASADSQAQANLLTFLPDFTVGGQLVSSAAVGQTQTTVTLSATNSAFKVGQTLTIATNGAVQDASYTVAPRVAMGWFAGKITSISGATLYTDLNYQTAYSVPKALAGSLNTGVSFSTVVAAGTTNQITISTLTSAANYGIAAGQTISTGLPSSPAVITAVSGFGVGAVLTLDTSQTFTAGTLNLTATYSDGRPMAYAADITNYDTLRVNHDENQYAAQFVTTPYYSSPSALVLETALSATGATTTITVRNQSQVFPQILSDGDTISLLNGDNYQQVTVSGTPTIAVGATGNITVTSFTPNFAYGNGTAIYRTSDDIHSRFGADLVVPVKLTSFANKPVARFKTMDAVATVTDGAGNVYGGTYSSSPYRVYVDDVSDISAGDLLTFRNEYNPWFANYHGGNPPTGYTTHAYPYSYGIRAITGDATSGITVSSTSSPVATLVNVTADQLPLAVGQTVAGSAATYFPGASIVSWTSTTITFSSNAAGTTASAVDATFYPGSSGFYHWRVQSVRAADNSFVIYGSSAYDYQTTNYPNGFDKNSIYKYNPFLNAGNSIDITNTTGTGPGVVGLCRPTPSNYENLSAYSPEITVAWHDVNTVVGSYQTGGRYVGSQSVGDQEVLTPYLIGSRIGSTLALDVTANSSDFIVLNALPNTANDATMDITGAQYNQYGNGTYDEYTGAQWAGFANIGTASALSSNYDINDHITVVIGQGATQEMVRLMRPSAPHGGSIFANPVDGSNNSNSPMIWYLDSDQVFQFDHDAGEPVFTPNFVLDATTTINHAKGAPVIGTPDSGTVFDGTNTSYSATPGIVATNPSNQLVVSAETYLNVDSPWLASGNQGEPNIATTLSANAIAGSSSLSLASAENFPSSYPAVFQNNINYLPPNLGRQAGPTSIGSTAIPIIPRDELPNSTPYFIRLGSEILQVTGYGSTTVGGNTVTTLLTATATTATHVDFTPIHINSIPTDVQYNQIEVPHFYLADVTLGPATFPNANTIVGTITGVAANTIGVGQTITGTGVPASTTVAARNSGLTTLSNSFTSTVSSATFTNQYTFANGQTNRLIATKLRSFNTVAGVTNSMSTLPSSGSTITGTGYAATTYLSALVSATNYSRISLSAAPTAFGSPATTSTLTFNATTTAGSRWVSINSINVSGTTYPKSGTQRYNGQLLNYYLKVGAPITTGPGGIGGNTRTVSAIDISNGKIQVSGTGTGITAVTASGTSVITFTADLGRAILVPFATGTNASEINRLFYTAASVADGTGLNTYIAASTTIDTYSAISSTQNEVLLSQSMASTTNWSAQNIILSTTFTGSSGYTNQINLASTPTGIQVGALVYGNQYIPDNTFISGINGTTLTLTNTLTNPSAVSNQGFKVSTTLNTQLSYTVLRTTPLPCQIAAGSTLWLSDGTNRQAIAVSSTASAGSTSISVNSFTPYYQFPTTSYSNGVVQTATGDYGYGAHITVGLASDLYPNQPIMLTANSDPNLTNIITVAEYTRIDARVIKTANFVSTYAYDGQATGFAFTADTVAGSNQITLTGAVSSLAVGQQLFSTVLNSLSSYFVTDISGLTVTLNKPVVSTNTAATFSVYTTSMTASYPMTVDTGSKQETVYPISLPPSNTTSSWTAQLAAPTTKDHVANAAFSYYQWPSSLQVSDVTYRPDYKKFLMWDGFTWRTARVNHVRALFSILGAVGGNDNSFISLYDPKTGAETGADQPRGTSSTGYSTYYGGYRQYDPNNEEWTGETLERALIHLKVRIPQGKSVGYRSLALEAEYRSAPRASSIQFSPGDNMEIAWGITNSIYWTYSDLEGEPQTGWEVRVFNDFTYNRPDFDPDNLDMAFWSAKGSDDTSETEIPSQLPWVNGSRYWVFVRVAKQFHQRTWWGDWESDRFVVTIDQPLQPIMSVFSDNDNAVNKLIIQATENLLGQSNGDFSQGLGQWRVGKNDTTNNDTASTTITTLIDGIPLGATLTQGQVYTSIPVGATGYVTTRGALSGTGTGTFKVSSTANATTDALGFPTSGRFWVRIDSEDILVTNNMDGNNNGDTFTIVQRGYNSTVAASHALGATVKYLLQQDLYVGTTATIDWKYQQKVTTKTVTKALVRWNNGSAGYTETPSRHPLAVTTQTQGKDKDSTDHCVVYDPNGLITKSDIGSTVILSFQHLNKQLIRSRKNGSSTVKVSRVVPANGAYEVEMVIAGVKDIYDNTVRKSQADIQIGHITRQVAGQNSARYSLRSLSVDSDVPSGKVWYFVNGNSCYSLNYLPKGSRLTIKADTVHDPVNNKDIGPSSVVVTLAADWHPDKDRTMSINPLGSAQQFAVGDKTSFILPKDAKIYYTAPVLSTGRKVITFKGKYADKMKGLGHQKLQAGDILYIVKGRVVPPVKATQSGSYTRTTVTPHTQIVSRDSDQNLVVDFSTAPVQSTGGVLGTLSGTAGSYTFTIGSGTGTTQYDTIAFSVSPGAGLSGSLASVGGGNLVAGATLYNISTVNLGAYAGYSAARFRTSTGATAYVGVQNSTATGATGTTPSTGIFTDLNMTLTPSSYMVVPKGSTSIPVKPFTPKFAFPKNTPVQLRYPSYWGEEVLVVDPAVGTGVAGDVSEISLYPPNWQSSSYQNPVPVRAGVTYGLAAMSKVVYGTGTPTFVPYLDWYDDYGNLIKSSDGKESLGGNGHTAGTTNSVTIGVQLNSTSNGFGIGWSPVALVAKAPQNFVTATATNFTSTSTSTGTFTVAAGTVIAMKAGTVLKDGAGNYMVVTSDTAAGATSLPVRFTAGLTISATNTLYIDATFAVPRFQWTSVKAADVYALSNVMLKSLTAPAASTINTVASTQIPALSTGVTVGNGKVLNAVVLPDTTVTNGFNSLYVFDPVGDYGTREIIGGGSLESLSTFQSASTIGATSVVLGDVTGLAPGASLILGYGTSSAETVTVSSSWDGSDTVAIAAPGPKYAHGRLSKVYSKTVGLGSEITTSKVAGTPVAVFNWGRDGYINGIYDTYQYKVERSEDEGVTWTTLRHGDVVKADETGAATITDYEVIPGKTTYYRATPTFVHDPAGTKNDYRKSGPVSNQLLANVVSNDRWWLSSTSDESLRYGMLVQTGYDETIRHPAGIFYPLGSSRPITLAGVPTGRDGNIKVIWTDNDNYEDFLKLLNKGETLILVNPVESDRKYIFIGSDISITHQAAKNPYREITISYVEAAPPNFGYTYGS